MQRSGSHSSVRFGLKDFERLREGQDVGIKESSPAGFLWGYDQDFLLAMIIDMELSCGRVWMQLHLPSRVVSRKCGKFRPFRNNVNRDWSPVGRLLVG